MQLICPICEGKSISTKLRKESTDILNCGDCQVEYWIPDQTFDPADLYGESYFEGSADSTGYDAYHELEDCLRLNFASRLSRIPMPRDGASLLDVGAAYGFAVEEAQRLGWRAVGTEIAASAARVAVERTQGSVAVACANDLPFPDHSFDAVTMWDVIEHLPSPHEAISEVSRVLSSGGRFVLSTGDVGSLVAKVSGSRWHLYTLPEHLYFFSRPALKSLVEQHGMRVESMHARSSRYPVSYLWERLRKTVFGLESAKSSRRARLAVPVNLFDIVTVTAVKL